MLFRVEFIFLGRIGVSMCVFRIYLACSFGGIGRSLIGAFRFRVLRGFVSIFFVL